VGNALPAQVLRLVELCLKAASGCDRSRRLAAELEAALAVLSKYDEGPDLVLYYKHLMVLEGRPDYARQINPTDALSTSQRAFLEAQWRQFRAWWDSWPGRE
jgi:4-hydroxy-tetrahydrodipicolinate synthase